MDPIAVFVDSFGNNASANGVCCANVIDSMKNKYDVSVFTFIQNNDEKKNDKINDVEIIRSWRVMDDFLKVKFGSKHISKIIAHIHYLCHLFDWPVFSYFASLKLVFNFFKKYKEQLPQKIVAVYAPAETFVAGYIIKKICPNIKLIIYTLDSLSGGQVLRLKKNKSLFKKSIRKLENKVFNIADLILPMNSHKILFNKDKEFYNKFVNKIQYVDVPLLLNKNGVNKIEIESKTIVYTGTLSSSYTNINYLIEFIRFMSDYKFYFYGKIDDNIIKQINSNDNSYYGGYLSQNEVDNVLDKAELLLNFGSNQTSMISGKIFNYIQHNKVILHLFDNDIDPALPYLKQYGKVVFIDERKKLDGNINNVENQIQCIYNSNIKINYDSFKMNFPSYTANIISKY